MKKMINNEKIEGRLYQHNLELKTVQNQASKNFGKAFIAGTIDIAVDEECLNVIPVHFTYVTETTATGNKNATFANLKKILDGGNTVINNGIDEALKIKVDTALSLNEFYREDGTLVSTKVNEGGFVSIVSNLGQETERNTFAVDMLITSVKRIEANPEKNIDKDYVSLRGAIFNFRNDLLPMEFMVKHEDGMKYFENLEISNSTPLFTKIWGKINCGTIINSIEEDSAFGESSVRTYERKIKEWVVTGTSKVAYDFGDEKVLTPQEVSKAMQDREVMLADIKKRSDEYRANKTAKASSNANLTNSQSVIANSTAKVVGDFNF